MSFHRSVNVFIVCHFVLKDFDAWFNTHSCFENEDLVQRLHAVSFLKSDFDVNFVEFKFLAFLNEIT